MNIAEVQKRNDDKLTESKAHSLMVDFQQQADEYPAAIPSLIDNLKKKPLDALSAASNLMYPYHTACNSVINDYGNSIILIQNDMPVKHMINEIAMFVVHLERFYKETEKHKQIQSLNTHYKTFKLKPKMLVTALIDDLKLYSQRYDFTVDIKEVMIQYEENKTEFFDFLKKEEEKSKNK
jgi:hypothetical protein